MKDRNYVLICLDGKYNATATPCVDKKEAMTKMEKEYFKVIDKEWDIVKSANPNVSDSNLGFNEAYITFYTGERKYWFIKELV